MIEANSNKLQNISDTSLEPNANINSEKYMSKTSFDDKCQFYDDDIVLIWNHAYFNPHFCAAINNEPVHPNFLNHFNKSQINLFQKYPRPTLNYNCP